MVRLSERRPKDGQRVRIVAIPLTGEQGEPTYVASGGDGLGVWDFGSGVSRPAHPRDLWEPLPDE